MPLLEIAIAQPCFHNSVHIFRSQLTQQKNLFYRNEKRLLCPWKYFCIPEKANNFDKGRIELRRGRLMIKAVATLESTRVSLSGEGFNLRVDADSALSGNEHQLSSEDLTELNEREKLRRMRISKANKGITPWNKGRKHSPETLRKIRERTRLAMQDPKVKMKLANLGHAQSKETRAKIGAGVRNGWERRRQLMKLQETCLYEWQNLIAEAALSGFVDEEELQWDSYKILNQQLEEEWLQSIEERKRTPRPKGSRRAPKSLEQRRRISQAISAKWADPSYRDRVYSGLARYHGVTIGIKKKPRRNTSEDVQTRKRSPKNKKTDSDFSPNSGPKSHIQQFKLKRNGKPQYKDPLVKAKLQMLKNIRAQRATTESKKSEALTRAKLLIAEAEKAAKALEVAAKKSPTAHASLIESRKLIAEAVQSIMSIEKGVEESQNVGSNALDTDDKTITETEIMENDVNGVQSLESSDTDITDYNFDTSEWQDFLADTQNVPASTLNCYKLVNGRENGGTLALDDTIKLSSFTEIDGHVDDANHSLINGLKSATVTEKCVLDDANHGSKSVTVVEEPEPKSAILTEKCVLDDANHGSKSVTVVEEPEPKSAIETEKCVVDDANHGSKSVTVVEEPESKSATVTKKWVRGRLVYVTE